jgi:hypothetical protein
MKKIDEILGKSRRHHSPNFTENTNTNASTCNFFCSSLYKRDEIDIIMSTEEKQVLRARAKQLCFNDQDPVSLSTWDELTIQQLRTLILLLDGDMVHFLGNQRSHLLFGNGLGRRHCFLVQELYRFIATVGNGSRNPLTNQALTPAQRRQIKHIYVLFLHNKPTLTTLEKQELVELHPHLHENVLAREDTIRNARNAITRQRQIINTTSDARIMREALRTIDHVKQDIEKLRREIHDIKAQIYGKRH